MREISPALYMTADQYLERCPELKPIAREIRRQKEAGERAFPSTVLVDKSSMLTKDVRERLLDKVAALVDENVVGRSDMCLQFADLLNRGLMHLKFPSRAVVGIGIYYDRKGGEVWRWRHAWARVADEIIDGNVDILAENPLVPKTVSVRPYWGPLADIPSDRRYREDHNDALPEDGDVDTTWWPDLREWIDTTLLP
jgi:hypothetical protein